MQQKHPEWIWQWTMFTDDSEWLFREWIWPHTFEAFRGKDILDCGCGGGQHLTFLSPYCSSITGVDLNTAQVARANTKHLSNVTVLEGDLLDLHLDQMFDIVYSVGVLHHTDNPDLAFENISRHCKPGGTVIVWVYAHEGNLLNRTLIEWFKWAIVRFLPRPLVWAIAHAFTLLLYVFAYTVYLLPFPILPYYEYLQNWRRLRYTRNLLNVFDKLNAPQTHFITRAQIERWFSPHAFEDIHISHYRGVSYRGSGRKKGADPPGGNPWGNFHG